MVQFLAQAGDSTLLLSIQTAQILGPRSVLLTAHQGESGWGIKADQSPPMELYLCSPTHHPGVHIDITFYCVSYLLLRLSAAMSSSLQICPKNTHTEQLSTMIYAGTILVIYAHPTSTYYYHVTFM
jgi:hypothetical protein